MLTDRLINEMGLLKLQAKTSNQTTISQTTVESLQQPTEPEKTPPPVVEFKTEKSMDEVKLDKNEFRLLVKMLQAIKHECIYDLIQYDGQTVTYSHPKKTLVFNDITLADSQKSMNLSSLKDLLVNSELKRPVWEKLKTLV